MAVYTPAKGHAVSRRLLTVFDTAVAAATPIYTQIATTVPSTGRYENYAWLGSMPGMREWIGERKFKELTAADYTLKNRQFESSLKVEKQDIADDSVGLYPPLVQELAAEASYFPDELAVQVLELGSVGLGYDGVAFFSDAHPNAVAGNQSNKITSEVVDATAVTAVEFKKAFNAAVRKIIAQKRDNGKPMRRPSTGGLSNFVVWIPPALLEAADTLFNSAVIDSSTNRLLTRPDVQDVAYLASSVKFYVFQVGGVIRPLIFQNREPITAGTKGEDDREHKEIKVMADGRFNVGYGMWEYACEVTLTE